MNLKLCCLFLLSTLFLLSSCSKSEKTFDSADIDQQKNSKDLIIIDHGPKGEVSSSISQIKFTFNKRMRELGSNKPVDGFFSSIPEVKCDFNWISETTVVCQLKKDLSKATIYKIQFKDGIKSLDGSVLKNIYEFEFNAERPKLVFQRTKRFEDKIPVGVLTFNMKIDSSKLSSQLDCRGGSYDANITTFLNNKSGFYIVEFMPDPKVVDLPLQNCFFRIKGSLETSFGSLKNELDVTLISDFPKTENEDKDKLLSIFRKISCGDQDWYRDRVANKKVCSVGNSLNISFKNKVGRDQQVEVIPLVENMKIDSNYCGLKIFGNFKANTLYDFKFKKGTGLDEDAILAIEFVDASPEAKLRYSDVVIERTGPHQLPLQSKNINSYKITGKFSSRPDQIAESVVGYKYDFNKLKETEIKVPYKQDNVAVIFPVEIDQLNEGRAGVYQINITPENIKPRILSADKKLFQSTLDTNKKHPPKYSLFNRSFFAKIQITDIGMHIKKGLFNTLIWVFDIPTGKPLANASVNIYGKNIEYGNMNDKETKTSDENGFVLVEMINPQVVVTQKGDDISYLSLRGYASNGLSNWNFNLPFSRISENDNFIIESIPDRPIYRPGDTVRLKFFARKWDMQKLVYIHPKVKELSIKIRDSRGEKVINKKITLNDFSTSSLEFILDKNAKLGDYRILVKLLGGTTFSVKGFKVQEYQLSPFKVESKFDKSKYMRGEKLKLSTKADYFFGSPYSNASGLFVVGFIQKLFKPKNDKYKQFRFHDSNNFDYYKYFYEGINPYPIEIARQNFITDKEGNAVYQTSTDKIPSQYLTGSIYSLTEVSGESGRAISTRKISKYFNSSHVLGAKFDKWSYKVGMGLSPQVIVLDLNDIPKKGIALEYELIYEKYETTRRLGTGNYYYYDSKTTKVSLGKCNFKSNEMGTSCSIKTKENGRHVAIIRGKDSKGLPIEVRIQTWAIGNDSYASWFRYNHDRIDILPDKYSYKLGETAKILIKSPFKECKALVTIERYGVIKKEIISIKGNTYVYQVPFKDSFYAPGIYVSVVLLKGRTKGKVEGNVDLGRPAFKLGYVKLTVHDEELKLNVVVKASKKILKPEQKIKLSFKVKDVKGNTGPFEIAVAVVDEAVLQLVGAYRQRYSLFETFYKMPSLLVANYQTLVGLLGRQTYGKKGGTPGGGGGFDKKIRDDFLAVMHWGPHIVTDKNGNAEIEITAPDNLTTWKVLVVANDKTRKFGLGETDFIVTKELLVEPVLPVFLTETDKVDAKLVVHNRSAEKVNVIAGIDADDFNPRPGKKELTINAKDKATVSFKLEAPSEGRYELMLNANGGENSDAMKYLMDIVPIQTLFVDGIFGHTETKKIEIPFSLPKDVKKGTQQMNLHISSTLLTGLNQSFRYVLGYPYGCWEQQLTKAMSLAFYDKLRNMIGDLDKPYLDAKEVVQDVINQAPKYMGSNGGMKYYSGEYTRESSYLSSYTAMAFSILSDLDYTIPLKVKSKLGSYLKSILSGQYSWPDYYFDYTRKSNKAMILDVLDKWGETGLEGYITSLLNDFNNIPLFGKNFLLNVLTRKKQYKKDAESLLDNLISNMDVSASKAQFVLSSKYFSAYYLDTQTRSQCAMASTMLKIKSDDQRMSKLINYITGERKVGRWYNTQENFYCFLALYQYSKIYEKDIPKFKAITKFSGKKINQSSLDLTKTKSKFNIDIKSVLPGGKSKVSIEKEGPGRMYYYAWLKYAKAKLPNKRLNQGFDIQKEIYKFDQQSKQWQKQDQKMNLKLGDILRIRLKIIIGSNRVHVGLDDPLAGCLTAINTELATAATASEAFNIKIDNNKLYIRNGYFDWYTGFRFMDMRTKSIQFYAPLLSAGEYGLEYDVRVTASGEFTMNAPSVEEMYFPDVRGHGLGRKMVVNE